MNLRELLHEIVLNEGVDVDKITDEFFDLYWQSVTSLQLLINYTHDPVLRRFIGQLNDIGNLIEKHIDSGK